VDDIVQSTLADALANACPPVEGASLDRWLVGIARHKVADYYRSHRRYEWVDDDIDAHNAAADTHPESAKDLLRWAHGELPADAEAPRTLEWMMREADGDRLESIAEENNISAPAVRQRVSRLRRYLRERWSLQLAAALTLIAVVIGTYAYKHREPSIEPDSGTQTQSAVLAEKLRASALADCRNGRWQVCLEQLDRAKNLDAAGDSADTIVAARTEAERALRPAPAPVPSATEERLVPAGETPSSTQPKKPVSPPVRSPSKKSNSQSKGEDGFMGRWAPNDSAKQLSSNESKEAMPSISPSKKSNSRSKNEEDFSTQSAPSDLAQQISSKESKEAMPSVQMVNPKKASSTKMGKGSMSDIEFRK
jgi:DNA-directed RNA polymerase specialized sigma24 family protein